MKVYISHTNQRMVRIYFGYMSLCSTRLVLQLDNANVTMGDVTPPNIRTLHHMFPTPSGHRQALKLH